MIATNSIGLEETVVRKQDADSGWYWIPEDSVPHFDKQVEYLEGKTYLDDPEAFDSFETAWGTHRTGGCPDTTPPEYGH